MPTKGIDLKTCPPAIIAKAILSPAEQTFVTSLKAALRNKVVVFLKVRVLDVIRLTDTGDRKQMYFWRDILGNSHFDYVICAKGTLQPLLAVELDDDKKRPRSTTADDVKTTAAQRAKFPLVRISATANYTPELLRQKLIADYKLAKAGPLPEGLA